nr:RNA-dependent RNA polymerase [Marmot picobirnavirus]
MQIESLPESLLTDLQKSAGLQLYLNNLETGRPATPRSWLYEQRAADDVLAEWMTELEKVKNSFHGEEVYHFDTSYLKKWGPQGQIAPLDELMDTIKASYAKEGTPKPSVFNSPLWKQAKLVAIDKLIRGNNLYKKLRPRALEKVVDDMASRDTLSSNSGFPSFTRRNNPFVKARAIRDARSGKAYSYPAIVLFRNYKQKTRMVWMFPMSMNLLEGQFTQPLKEALMNSKDAFFSAWRGFTHVKQFITAAYQESYYVSASDFSHTDEHFTKFITLEVYDVIKYAFQPQYWLELKKTLLHVNSIPLLIATDKIIYGDHGVSSGSNWTNDMETYFDYIAEIYLELKNLVSRLGVAIGDDIAHVRSHYSSSLSEDIAQEYQSMGLDVNAEKVTNNIDNVKFLQRLFVKGYYSKESQEDPWLLRGVYSTVWALCTSLYPEKFHSPKLWSKQMFAARQFMILENCVDHPLFHEFVTFICKGNSYLTEFAKLSADKLDEAQRKSHLIPGFNPTYNQEKKDKPLSSFASIRYAAKL